MSLLEPLFVIGNPRSGTSLLRLMLSSHSRVLIPPECGFIVWLHDKYAQWTQASTQDAQARSAFLDDLNACKKFDTWGLAREQVETTILALQPQSYAALCGAVVFAYARAQGKDISLWGDKNNFYTQCVDTLIGLYPAARFLHIVRDGRDVAVSYREVMRSSSSSPYAPHLNTDAGDIAAEWSDNVTRVEQSLSGIASSRRALVHYEDLVADPEAAMIKICEWLGLEFQPGMLSPHLQGDGRGLEPPATLDWKRRTLEPVSADTVGRYRVAMPADDIQSFEAIAGPVLTRFGYSPAPAND